MIMILNLVGCGTSLEGTPIRNMNGLNSHIGESTVALVGFREDLSIYVYCTGVWVGDNKIVTAGHCVKDEENPELDVVGTKLYYVVQKEVSELKEDPTALHLAKVNLVDNDHDLALLEAYVSGAPSHRVAKLAEELPGVGEGVYMVGHPRGLYYSYVSGTISAYKKDSSIGPAIQINGTIWFGNSGGGIFDNNGNLLGICSRMAGVPGMSLFVHLDSIKELLKG